MKLTRDKRDRIFSLIVRERDNWTCTRCQKVYQPPTMALHCSHFFGRANMGTRWDLENADSHCYGCHQYLGSNPQKFREWKLARLGEERFRRLEVRARRNTHFRGFDLEVIHRELKKTYAALLSARKNGYRGSELHGAPT